MKIARFGIITLLFIAVAESDNTDVKELLEGFKNKTIDAYQRLKNNSNVQAVESAAEAVKEEGKQVKDRSSILKKVRKEFKKEEKKVEEFAEKKLKKHNTVKKFVDKIKHGKKEIKHDVNVVIKAERELRQNEKFKSGAKALFNEGKKISNTVSNGINIVEKAAEGQTIPPDHNDLNCTDHAEKCPNTNLWINRDSFIGNKLFNCKCNNHGEKIAEAIDAKSKNQTEVLLCPVWLYNIKNSTTKFLYLIDTLDPYANKFAAIRVTETVTHCPPAESLISSPQEKVFVPADLLDIDDDDEDEDFDFLDSKFPNANALMPGHVSTKVLIAVIIVQAVIIVGLFIVNSSKQRSSARHKKNAQNVQGFVTV